MTSKFCFFPQSSAIDKVLAQRILDQSGYRATKLNYPILYRGDTRSPYFVFSKGFTRKNIETTVTTPSIDNTRCSSNCVATSTELVHAIGFADNPDWTIH